MVLSPQIHCLLIFFSIDGSQPPAMRTAAGSAAKKYDEFPSPHGFARAEDYIGYGRISHFWIENCSFDPRRYVRFWVISGHFGVFGHVRFSAESRHWPSAFG